MGKNQDRTVYQRDDGKWVNKRNDTDCASSLHDTQKDAADAAKENLQNQGGGELTIMGRDHKIRSKPEFRIGISTMTRHSPLWA